MIRGIPRQNYSSRRHIHPCVHRMTIYNSQDIETTSESTDRWMDKEDIYGVYIGIVAIEKNSAICSNKWMGPKNTIPSKLSHKEKDKYHSPSTESKIRHKWTYIQNRNRLRDVEGTLVVAKGGGGDRSTGSLGSADANCYILDGSTARSCCTAREAIFNIMW